MSIAPPRPKGPPLNALRAFEAAARLNSFSRAADELCVTPGAVAQHIKALEEWTSAPLFDRHAQGVRLTPLGRAVAPDLGDAFDSLADAAHLLRRIAAPDEIRIAALPSVAQLWLSPRLPAIRRTSPDLGHGVGAPAQPDA
jgi:LysR family glycine cleavage system transcriptional activator